MGKLHFYDGSKTSPMIFNLLSKKNETEEQLIIRWADILVTNSDSKGELDTSCFALDYHLSTYSAEEIKKAQTNPSRQIRDVVLSKLRQPDRETLQLDMPVNELLRFRSAIQEHLLKEDYINTIEFDKKWILTERGRLMKELGGYKQYKRYRKSEIELITNQGFINKLLITATALAAIMPFLAVWLFPPKVNVQTPEQIFRPDIRVDSVWLHQQVDELIQKKLYNQQPAGASSATQKR